jgi:1-acyl-sn-glycerol-3-phosphate acyltransferase
LIARLRRLYEYLVFYTGLLLFGAWALAWSSLSALLCLVLPRAWRAPLGRMAVTLFCRAFLGLLRASGIVRIDLSALDALRGERSLIIAPNHPSLLDMVLLASRLPDLACIIKAPLRDSLLLGGGARLAGYLCNDPPLLMVRGAVSALRAGRQLLIFPEGTRTTQGPVSGFKGGFALIAKGAGAPVQTVFIETNTPFLGKDWPLLRKPAFPLVYRARLGQRFEMQGETRAFVAQLERYYQRELGAGAAAPARIEAVHSSSAVPAP